MRVDWQTLQDLGILNPDGQQASLFDWVNFTRTVGGERLLRERFRRPMSSAPEIRATQASMRWLADHASLFHPLLEAGAWASMERYAASSITTLDHPNRFVLWLDSWWMRHRHADLYREVAAALSQAQTLARYAVQVARSLETLPLPAMLTAWREELRECVSAPPLARLVSGPDVHRSRAYRVLLLDRELRLQDFAPLTQLAALTYRLDALRSLGLATRKRKLVLPEILEEGGPRVEAEALYHPMLDAPVGNPLRLSPEGRLVFLTGANMAGKSTYLKAAGVAVFLAQLGMGVPARRFRLTPFDCLFSGINTTDNLRLGESYFYAEVRRVQEIVEVLARDARALVLFDEMFKGTNLKDASDACLEVLSGFAACEGSAFLVASHIAELAKGIRRLGGVRFIQFGADAHDGTPSFDYRLRPGVSQQRLGMLILEREGVLDRLRRLGPRAPLP